MESMDGVGYVATSSLVRYINKDKGWNGYESGISLDSGYRHVDHLLTYC